MVAYILLPLITHQAMAIAIHQYPHQSTRFQQYLQGIARCPLELVRVHGDPGLRDGAGELAAQVAIAVLQLELAAT